MAAGANPVRGYLLALVCVGLVSVAQLSLKLGVAILSVESVSVPGLFWLLLGLSCYAASLLLWINVLSYLPLSVAYPLLSLSYVLVYLIATRFPAWNEASSWQHSGGIALIVLGVVLVSLQGRHSGSA